MKYEKPPTSLSEQLELLINRGMEIPDPEAAEFYLRHIGYYRLRGYWIPLEQSRGVPGTHQFSHGTTFDQVLNLYTFDRELRLLITDAIERIEISVRNQWVDVVAHTHGAHGYLKSPIFSDYRQYGRSLAELAREFDQSKEIYAKHYKKTYTEPDLPPLWTAVGLITLGQFSFWLSNLRSRSLKGRIAKVYRLDEGVMTSFLRHLTFIRNVCAHHARLWNREATVTMSLPRTKPAELIPNIDHGPDPNQAPRRIYNTLVMILYFMNCISPGHHWRSRLFELIHNHRIDVAEMGFPINYLERPLWAV